MPGFFATSSVPNAAEACRAESQAAKETGSMGSLFLASVLPLLLSWKYWTTGGIRACQAAG